jgi:hypothetical protein
VRCPQAVPVTLAPAQQNAGRNHAGESAQVTLDDLIRGIREDGLDPRADKIWIVVEVVDAKDTATFDPRKPYVRHR